MYEQIYVKQLSVGTGKLDLLNSDVKSQVKMLFQCMQLLQPFLKLVSF